MGKDNIVFHTVIWPSILLGYGEGGEVGAGKPLDAPARHRRERVPDDGGQAVQRQPRRLDRRRRLPQPLRPRPAALLPDRGRARDSGHRLHVVGVRPPEQRRARRELGQPRQPNADRGRTRTSARSPSRASCRRPTTGCWRAIEAGFDTVGDAIESARFKAALAEAMRLASLVNQYTSEQAPWALIDTDRERAGTVLYVACGRSTA